MATKTISLEVDAYEKLRQAKRQPRESFSSVVRRARWEDAPLTAGVLLEKLQNLVARHPEVLLSPNELDAMDKRKRMLAAESRQFDPGGNTVQRIHDDVATAQDFLAVIGIERPRHWNDGHGEVDRSHPGNGSRCLGLAESLERA